MISKYSFNCNRCKRHFEVNGYWYNQMLIHWWCDFKWICHCAIYHRDSWNWYDLAFVGRMIISFPVLLILQILDIITNPLRNL